MRATVHVLSVRVVELLLLVGHGLVLAHVHWLIHLAVLFVARELIRVNHGKHLGETLTHTGDSLRRVSEGELVPWHELDALAVHVDETFLAGGARQAAEWLLAEHGILLVLAMATLRHDQVVQILELLLMDLECLARVTLVSKLLRQGFDDVRKSVLEGLVHLSEVGLLVQRVLHLFHPLRELVTQMGQLHFQVVDAVYKSVKCFLTDAATGTFRDLKVCEGILQAQEPLLES